ncbi:SDR family oxidoreductase [Granulicella sp. dw_53]|uniref:SDR family oxidoreductase n=1 Tax=Granulicella sp. dw_53 TaxID=2719792 RepID=UPI001BD3CC9B|nr:SDR family oxidoreductase [Granulicella sp. dw_53]
MSKTILITGASSGFGRDTAETLALAGHTVFASMRDVAGRNRLHANALRARGIYVGEIDVTDDASVQKGVDLVLAETGRVDVVINNAGLGSLNVSEAFTSDQLRELFDVNVIGVQRVLRAVLPTLRSQHEGLVINIGSIFGRVVVPFNGAYAASKFAVEALNDTYRYELSQFCIDVVLIQPGSYPTNMFVSAQYPGDVGRVAAYGPIGTIPEKILQTILDGFKRENAPDPHDVAVAIADLITQSNGSRPDRVVVGQAFGADLINGAAATVQSKLLEALGLAFLAQSPAVPAGV